MLKLLCLIALVAAAASASAPASRQYSRNENQSLGEYIKALLNNLKESMPDGIPDLNIPPLDPLNVEEFTANIKEGMADIRLDMKQLKVTGLSSFVVREAEGDLNTMTFSLDIFVPEITGVGQYDLDGKVLIFPLYGKGTAGLRVSDLHFEGTATISLEDKSLQLTNFNLHAVFSQIELYLENIVGGGNLGNLVNTLVNMLGKTLYDKFKDQILPSLNNIIKNALNEQLKNLNIADIIGGVAPPVTAFSVAPVQDSVNTYVDRLMENIRPFLKEQKLDPLSLPQASTGFSKRVLGISWRGGAALTSGTVNSLSSIHRIGNFQLISGSNSVTIDGTVGLNRLWGSLQSSAWFMSLRVNPGVTFSVDRVRVRARITANFDAEGEFVELEHFGISEMSRIEARITGLGALGWVLNPLANLVVNLVRGKIIAAIEHPVRQEIINLLANVELPQIMRNQVANNY